MILPKLGQSVIEEENQSSAFLETRRTEIITEIKRELGYNHPIAILVEMTTQFDVESVKRIIQKLESIREAVIQGQQDEETRETSSVQTF